MACNPEFLNRVPLFALLDPDETAVLASQVDVRNFAPRQRIYKINDAGGRAYVLVSGRVRVSTVDQDNQEVVVDEPGEGEFFGFASMLEQTPHQTDATALEESVCLEVDREDIAVSVAAEAAFRDGYAHRAGPAVPCGAATGEGPRQPQCQRDHRRRVHMG